MTTLTALDWIVIGAYFLVLLAIVVVELRRQKTATDYFLAGRNVGFFAIGGAPHFVEIRWARASAPAANDGVFELWIDGIPLASAITLDNNRSSVDFVRMGALSVKPGASGTLYFDEFESRRETDIGP